MIKRPDFSFQMQVKGYICRPEYISSARIPLIFRVGATNFDLKVHPINRLRGHTIVIGIKKIEAFTMYKCTSFN